jgi:hypothetical protein
MVVFVQCTVQHILTVAHSLSLSLSLSLSMYLLFGTRIIRAPICNDVRPTCTQVPATKSILQTAENIEKKLFL